MEKVKVGVIGVGDFGERHAQVYSELPQTELTAVADLDENRAKKCASMYGARRWYTEYEKLLEENIDIVSICTPEQEHCKPAVAAAQAGKHIVLEKPIATNLEDADKILDAVAKAGVKLTIGFIFRFIPERVKLKQYVESNMAGEIVIATSMRHTRLSSARIVAPRMSFGANVLEECIHDIDLLLWWVDNDVETVYAQNVAKRLIHEFPNCSDLWAILLRFKNGAIGTLESSWILPVTNWEYPKEWKKGWVSPYVRYKVIGTKGMVNCDAFPPSISAWDEKEGWKFPDEGTLDFMFGQLNGALRFELSHFVDYVNKDIELVGATGQDGRKSLEIALAAIRSAQENKPIKLPLGE